MKTWMRNKCLTALMNVIQAKEGEWFEGEDKEWKVVNGVIYSRPLVRDIVNVGIMIENADRESPLRNGYSPRLDSAYYYWIVDAVTKEWRLQCAIHHDTERDRQNIRMRNCFPDALTAEKYKTGWKKTLS